MKWFYNLKRSIRIIIAVAAWLPLVIFAGVISGSIGENGENMQAWQAVVVLLLLAVGVVFTVFAVIARRRETKAERDAKSAARTPSETATQRPSVNTAPAANNARQAAARMPAPLPTYKNIVKLSVFENRVAGVPINAGDPCIIKFESDAIMRSSNGNPIIDANCYIGEIKIGLFPYCKQLRAVYGKADYNCRIASCDIIDGKHDIRVEIDMPFIPDKKLPIQTKINGVTFDNRQSIIAASVVGDMLTVKHAPTAEYPNTIAVYNNALNGCIGVVPSDVAEKILKKYKDGCAFDGVITSIYGGGVGKNFGVDIMILTKRAE